MKSIHKERKQNNIQIPIDDLKFILGKEWEEFENKITTHCYCGRCKSDYVSTITNYTVTFNDLNDIVLKGFCKRCNSPIGRYVETGEVKKYINSIKELRNRYTKN